MFCDINRTVCDVGTSTLKTTATSSSRLDMEATVIYVTTNQNARSHKFAVYVTYHRNPPKLVWIKVMQILLQGPNHEALGTILFLKVHMQQISSKSIQSAAN